MCCCFVSIFYQNSLGGGEISMESHIYTSHWVAGAMEQRYGFPMDFWLREWWEAQLEYRAWTGICYIAKDTMCWLQKLLADKDTSSCDIPHSDDNEELVANDSILIICELWILRKLAWKLEVCHDMTFRPHVAPVCDNRHDDFNQPGYPRRIQNHFQRIHAHFFDEWTHGLLKMPVVWKSHVSPPINPKSTTSKRSPNAGTKYCHVPGVWRQ